MHACYLVFYVFSFLFFVFRTFFLFPCPEAFQAWRTVRLIEEFLFLFHSVQPKFSTKIFRIEKVEKRNWNYLLHKLKLAYGNVICRSLSSRFNILSSIWFWCLPVDICFRRYFIVLGNTSAFTSKLSSLAWLLFTWHSFDLWVMRTRLVTTATALRLGQMAGNSFGREHHEVFAIATGKSEIATTVSLFNETWPYFSLEEIRRSWN